MSQTPDRLLTAALVSVSFAVACSSATPREDDAVAAEPAPDGPTLTETLPPPGYGTLRQDDFTVAFQADDVQVKVTPLHEAVIRLAAPDTYRRLHGLIASRRDQIRRSAGSAGLREDPGAYFVSFFTYERQAEFTPTDLQILSQGMLYRPIDIIPMTPGWGQQQLHQEQTQSALYLFESGIDIDVGFRVEYGNAGSLAWGRIIRTLEAERGRVMGRAK